MRWRVASSTPTLGSGSSAGRSVSSSSLNIAGTLLPDGGCPGSLSGESHAPTLGILLLMCRNIRVLHHFQPPTTPEEVRAAALQYVRKVSGQNAPLAADVELFEQAVLDVTTATERLLAGLHPRGEVRTREGEREKAKIRWQRRETRMREPAKSSGS